MQMSVTAEPRSRHFKKKSSRERERGNRNMRFFLNIAPNRIATHEKEGGPKKSIDLFHYNALTSEAYK